MVRNAISMQDLRSDMSELKLSSMQPKTDPQAPSTSLNTSREPPQRLQTLGSRQSMQLCGQDAHTKALMNRIATGQATDVDHAEFNSQVQGTYGQSNFYVSPPPMTPQQSIPSFAASRPHSNVHVLKQESPTESRPCVEGNKRHVQNHFQQLQNDVTGTPVNMQPAQSAQSQLVPGYLGFLVAPDQANNRALQDYNMGLMLLEQQNRKRKELATQDSEDQRADSPPIRRARHVSDKTQSTWSAGSSISESSNPNNHPGFKQTQEHHAPTHPEYMEQLSILEQQNKKRLQLAREEQDRMTGDPTLDPLRDFRHNQRGPHVSKPIHKPHNQAKVDYDMQLMLLEQQNRKRLLMARREQDCMAGDSGYGPDDAASNSTMTGLQRSKSQMEASMQTVTESCLDAARFPRATGSAAEVYCKPFCDFLTDNPTVFHAVDSTKTELKAAGWQQLSERDAWDIKPSGRYFVERNGSSLIVFVVGANYEPGNGAAILAGHVDALCAKLKPVSEVPNKAGYIQLGVAPYAGAMSDTWWDRDLGIGGRVLVQEGDKIVTKLVKLDWPIARIPSLAPHFGAAAQGPFNKETQMTPIIGLEGVDSPPVPVTPYSAGAAFVNKQPPALVRAIGNALGLSEQTYSNIVNWELELFDVQPATVGGLNKEFIYGGRIDDKLCSWAAMQALTGSSLYDTRFSSLIKVVGWFDNEEIGSQLRQGARSNFLPQVLERAVGSLSKHHPSSDLMGRTYANSFILSSDVTHAVNPNFLNAYLGSHAPKLNTGLVVAADANGHMTTDAVSTAILQRCADRVGAKLQVFQIRNDSRSGGTVGPMLSSMTGIRAIDAGLPQLSMHSIRATTGSLDPGLGVIMFTGFLNGFEHVDKEFRS